VERDVTLKLGVKARPGLTDPYRQMAAAAKGAADQEARLKQQMDQGIATARQAAEADRAFAQNKQALVAQVEREIAARQRLQAMAQTRKEMGVEDAEGEGGGGGGRGRNRVLGAFGRMFHLGHGPLMAFIAALKGAELALKTYEQSIEAGRFSWASFEDAFVRETSKLPLIGWAFKSSTEAHALDERDRRHAELEQANKDLETRHNILSGGREKIRGLGEQRENALEAVRADLGEDAAGEGQTQKQRELGKLDEAHTRSLEEQRDLQGQLQESYQRQVVLEKSINVEGLRQFQIDERRLQLQGELITTGHILGDLAKAQEQSVANQQKAQEALLQSGAKRISQLQTERDKQAGLVEKEDARLQTMREQFGLLDPLKRFAVLNIAQRLAGGAGVEGPEQPGWHLDPLTGKLKRGGGGEGGIPRGRGRALSKEELEFAKGQEIFKEALGKLGDQRAGPEFEQLVRLLGLNQRREQAAAAQVQLENKINVEIKLNEQALLEQLYQKLLPEIMKAQFTAKQVIINELAKQRLEEQANRKAAAG
jgi:hypothetical protein